MGNSMHFNTTASNRPIEASLDGLVTASGRLSPVLVIPLRLRQLNGPDSAQLRLLSVVVEATCAGEVLGQGSLAGRTLWQNTSNTVNIRIPTNHRMLAWASDSVARTRIGRIELSFYGAIQYRDVSNQDWIDEDVQHVGGAGTSAIEISRSDWHDHVLSPTRQADYLYLEIELKRSTRDEWEPALARLHDAEEAYAHGNDSAAFGFLRGCIDALPGAKRAILDGVADPRKRAAINDLLKQFGNFLHLGRHVSDAESPVAGSFPVDRVDAGFAISATKVLLAYISAALPREGAP
jgi:hypothetical protein